MQSGGDAQRLLYIIKENCSNHNITSTSWCGWKQVHENKPAYCCHMYDSFIKSSQMKGDLGYIHPQACQTLGQWPGASN